MAHLVPSSATPALRSALARPQSRTARNFRNFTPALERCRQCQPSVNFRRAATRRMTPAPAFAMGAQP